MPLIRYQKALSLIRDNRTFRGASEITQTTLTSIPYIVAGIASAIVCSVYSQIFQTSEGLARKLYQLNPNYLFLATPICFVVGWILVYRHAPGSAGSGIPQVLASLTLKDENSSVIKKFLSWPMVVIKILSSSIMALGAGAVGREGPSIQISAAIFFQLRNFWERFGFKPSYYNMIIAGAAGGLAAAFNTPLGGIIYAVEELSKEHIGTIRLGLLEAVIAAGFLAQLINGPYLYLGFPVLPQVTLNLLVTVAFISLACGIAGAFFGVILFSLLKVRKNLTFKKGLLFAGAAGFAVALLAYVTGPMALGSGKEIIKEVLFQKAHADWLEVIARFASPILTSISGAAGGIFAPCLAAGAALGEWIGNLADPRIQTLAPICGMIAFLTGVTRAPMTAFVLILEMTDRHSAIFALMLSALFALIAARAVDSHSFYERVADSMLKDHFPEPVAEKIT